MTKPTKCQVVDAILKHSTLSNAADAIMALYEEQPEPPKWEKDFDGLFEAENRKYMFREPPFVFKIFIRSTLKEFADDINAEYYGNAGVAPGLLLDTMQSVKKKWGIE